MDGIARANVDRFKLLLETETNPSKRAMLLKLLAEEETKLAQISGSKRA
jgi:hypothetical protein